MHSRDDRGEWYYRVGGVSASAVTAAPGHFNADVSIVRLFNTPST